MEYALLQEHSGQARPGRRISGRRRQGREYATALRCTTVNARRSGFAGRCHGNSAAHIRRKPALRRGGSQKQGRIKCLPRPSAFSASGLVPKLNATRDRSVGVQIRRTTRQLGAAETGSAPGSSIAHHKRRDRTWTSDSSDSGSWEHPWLPTWSLPAIHCRSSISMAEASPQPSKRTEPKTAPVGSSSDEDGHGGGRGTPSQRRRR